MAKTTTSERVSNIATATLDTGKAAVKKVRSLAGSVLGRSARKSKATKAAKKTRPAKRRKSAKRAKK